MKLKKGFITHDTKNEQIMVGVGAASFSGLVKSNKTAAFIIDCLKTETTKEEILDRMEEKYDASREIMAADVDKVVDALRTVNAIEGI